MSTFIKTARRTGSSLPLATFGGGFGAAIANLAFALQVRRERRLLSSLSLTELKDIGLSHGEAHRESVRSLFDLPDQNPHNRRLARD